MRSDQALEDRRQPFQTAAQGGAGDGAFRIALLREENLPAARAGPDFRGDDGGLAAVADLGVAHQEIRDLHGRDDLTVAARAFGFMMIARGFDHDVGQIVVLQIERAEFGVLDAENLRFPMSSIGRGSKATRRWISTK
jgi:hypothetical protein